MKKILLMMFTLAVSVIALSCNYSELDDAFDKAKDRAMYGNWCGPGMSGPDAPIDSLDALCRTHDLCYETQSIPYEDYAACTPDAAEKIACDKNFVNGMTALGPDSDSSNWAVKPPAEKKGEAEQYLKDAMIIFGQCVALYP